MTGDEFARLLDRFCDAASRGDGKAFAECFTPDGVYQGSTTLDLPLCLLMGLPPVGSIERPL